MRINCIGCGHRFDVDGSYEDYRGLLRCPTCAELLTVHIEDGMIRSVMPGSFANAAPQAPAPTAGRIGTPVDAPIDTPVDAESTGRGGPDAGDAPTINREAA